MKALVADEATWPDLVISSVYGKSIRPLTMTSLRSGPTEIGMSRLSLSDTDKQARDWFDTTTRALGCTVTVDQMGNQFAVRSGSKKGPPTFAGSHLDTQPTVPLTPALNHDAVVDNSRAADMTASWELPLPWKCFASLRTTMSLPIIRWV